MAYSCPGCSRTFSESRGYGIHIRRYCPDLHNLVSWTEQYNNKGEGSQSIKRPQDQGYPLDTESDMMLVDDCAPNLGDNSELALPPEPLEFISFSGCKQKVPHVLKDYLPHSLAGLPLHLCATLSQANPTPLAITADVPSLLPDPTLENVVFRTDPIGFGLH